MRQRVRQGVAAVVSLAALGGCWGPPGVLTLEPGDVPELEIGMTRDELTRALRDRTCWKFEARRADHNRGVYRQWGRHERTLIHQFTIFDDEGRVLRCSQSQVIRPSFLFLLTDGALTRVMHALGMAPTVDPAVAAEAILATPPVDLDRIASMVQQEVDEENAVRRYFEPPPVPHVLFPTERGSKLRERARLLDTYDAHRLRLGMLPTEASALFGPPTETRECGADESAWIYRDRSHEGTEEITVTLVFRRNRLEAMYTQLTPSVWTSRLG